jgi:hypothetical protein
MVAGRVDYQRTLAREIEARLEAKCHAICMDEMPGSVLQRSGPSPFRCSVVDSVWMWRIGQVCQLQGIFGTCNNRNSNHFVAIVRQRTAAHRIRRCSEIRRLEARCNASEFRTLGWFVKVLCLDK